MEQLLPAPEPPAQWPISPEASARRSEEERAPLSSRGLGRVRRYEGVNQ